MENISQMSQNVKLQSFSGAAVCILQGQLDEHTLLILSIVTIPKGFIAVFCCMQTVKYVNLDIFISSMFRFV